MEEGESEGEKTTGRPSVVRWFGGAESGRSSPGGFPSWLCSNPSLHKKVTPLPKKPRTRAARSDRAVALKAIGASGLALEHLSDALRRDRSVVEAALLSDGRALAFASAPLQRDRGLVKSAVIKSGAALACVTDGVSFFRN